MAKKIVVSRPGIGGEEREMILDAAAEAGYEVIFIPETAGESAGTGTAGDGVPDGGDYFAELLDAEIIYGEGPAVNAAAAQSDALKWLCESFAGACPARLKMRRRSSPTGRDHTASRWPSTRSCWRL